MSSAAEADIMSYIGASLKGFMNERDEAAERLLNRLNHANERA
jgi:hypothetical protein